MKWFTDARLRLALVASVILVLSACSGAPRKNEAESDTSAVATGTQTGNVAGQQAFNPDAIMSSQYTAASFGPDPYLANAPYVSDIDKQAMADALALIEDGETEKAQKALESLVESLPRFSGPAYNLAQLKKDQKDLEGAQKAAQLAVERNQYNTHARNLLALIYREQGDFENAEAQYKEALSIWGGYAPAYRNLGILYDMYMGQPEKALGYYKQYNMLQAKPSKQVTGWTVDIERRVAAARKREQAELEAQQAAEAAAAAEVAAQQEASAATGDSPQSSETPQPAKSEDETIQQAAEAEVQSTDTSVQ
ncbi:Uncharacterised protein [BD1-7 clade bacterium]|uniref:Tetratricopeptide repeat protein n=1 Tax=BD1-7 clade bacterium TaxID=2029982 RepID=A0A5S9NMQ2_9GAMM|nr:Uncharacterised protein [BD1-7 clade bacterium]CAA0093328.1 Uncharacterised protein [BD1-7 clade bacterium]